MQITFVPLSDTAAETVALPCISQQALPQAEEALDAPLQHSPFKAKKSQTEVLLGIKGAPAPRTVLVGLGEMDDITLLSLQEAGGAVAARLAETTAEATISLKGWQHDSISAAEAAANMALGAALRGYRFDKYKTVQDKDGEKKPKLASLNIALDSVEDANDRYKALAPVASAVYLTRSLQNEPANVIYPVSLARAAQEQLEAVGVKVTILGEERMRKLGMNALLGVGQGSANESQLVIMEYRGAPDKKAAPLAFVGKGVTFDTGGISIKPSGGMEDMKWDMGGSGVVIGLMKLLAARKAPVNAVGVIGLVENMPSGTAQRPGDIVKSMSGQTIEILNTDAEGRLVLADALWYTQEEYAPKLVIDLATLTGAIVVALGEITAGLFSNNDDLAAQLQKAATAVDEPLWRLPMNKTYDKDIDSDIADMKNIGSGRGAGSTTAAQFLQRFIKKDMPWAHLDIAGTTFTKKPTALCPKGATAFGVRLLNEWVKQTQEKPAASV